MADCTRYHQIGIICAGCGWYVNPNKESKKMRIRNALIEKFAAFRQSDNQLDAIDSNANLEGYIQALEELGTPGYNYSRLRRIRRNINLTKNHTS